jgi:hypothetical protein
LVIYYHTTEKHQNGGKKNERLHDGKNPRIRKENPNIQKILNLTFLFKKPSILLIEN